jgi:exonuclease III
MNLKLGRLCSFNANGLGDKIERAKTIKWLKKQCKGIIMIQEAHCCAQTEEEWKTYFGKSYNLYFSHGTTASRGVVTAIPERLHKSIIDQETDQEGRLVIVELKIDKIPYVIFNIYNHCQDKERDQIKFLAELNNKFKKYAGKKIIAAGDFNIIQNPKLDKWKAKETDKASKPAEELKDLLFNINMVDIWRLQNPTTKKYTWIRRTKKGTQQSRLDYFLISDVLAAHTCLAEITPGFKSDHSLITIEISNTHNTHKGKGYWKFNNSLLNDEEYIKYITPKFKEYLNLEETDTDSKLYWDTLKMKLRRDTITYSIYKSKVMKAKRAEVLSELNKAEEALNNSDKTIDGTTDLAEQYFTLKNEWQGLENSKIAGQMLRSKAQWIEEGERNTKFFIGLEKHKQEMKNITELTIEDNKIITCDDKILSALNKFYKQLYDKNTVDKNLMQDFTSDCTLNVEDIPDLECKITQEECKTALDDMPSNKSPGLDGFTIEFYKKFWHLLKKPYIDCLNEIFKSGEMSHDQRQGVISLIPKGDKDPRFIKNWRPISLLNVDYKILTKILANRIKKTLPSIIHQDQSAYVQDRQIGQNIRVVQDLIDFCKTFHMDGALLLIDFEKAFDSISWSFLQHALEQFGFGENFRRWIHIIYNNIQSHVQNNGHISQSFKLGRGIRQGCPISPYLFIVCVELLAKKIRESSDVEGLCIGQVEHKILQFADDTVLLVKNKKSIMKALEIIDSFSKCSGLKINIEKTELYRLGNNLPFNVVNLKLKWVSEFKYLGIHYSSDNLQMEFKNFRHRLDNIRNLLRIWKQRDLSLKGKVTILKTLAMSQLIYPMSMLFCPEWVAKEAEKYFYDFLWDGKPDKVNRNTVIRSIEEGGLKMIDINAMARALKCNWVKKICNIENWNQKWTCIPRFFFYNFSIEEFCASQYTENMLPALLPDFYRQCLLALSDLKPDNPNSIMEIKNQYIWYNKYILQNGKHLMYNDWYQIGIVKIKDLLDVNNKFVSLEHLEQSFGLKKGQELQYNIIKCCIPASWRRSLKKGNEDESLMIDEEWHIDVCINDSIENLEYCSTKVLYKGLVALQTNKELKCVKYWQELLGITKEELFTHFYIPYTYIRDVKIQSMQFKIIHNIYSNNLRKQQWRVYPSSTCHYCDKVDDIIHHFCSCNDTELFWHGLIEWFNRLSEIDCIVKFKDILLGYTQKEFEYSKQLNFIILFAKWYIFRTKYLKEKIFLLEFLAELKSRLKAERLIYLAKDEMFKFEVTWSWVLDEM